MHPEVRSEQATPTPRRARYIQTAEASPTLAAQHDKDAWLELYADGAAVEDPVGTPKSIKGQRPGRRGDELGRFYEAFIAPSEIEIESHQDIVADKQVFRSVTIHTKNTQTGLQMQVPANLVYDIVDHRGELKVSRMRAHWEISRMSRLIARRGARGYATMAVMNWSMLRAFGPKWLGSYFKLSQQGVRGRGKEAVVGLSAALDGRGDPKASFTSDAKVCIPGQGQLPIAEAISRGFKFGRGDALASGWTVSGLYDLQFEGRSLKGAAIFGFKPNSNTIAEVELYWDR